MSMTIALPSQGSTSWYSWASNLDSEIRLIGGKAVDATTSTNGLIRLAGDLGGTAAAPTVPGLALKAPIDSPTFTGTVSGVTKSMIGLSNVDNTSDANKPVSTAQAAAINSLTKVVTFPTGSEPTLAGVADGTLWVEYTP